MPRSEVMRRFAREDADLVRGILFDLVESGLVFQKGKGDATVYRLASAEDFERVTSRDESASAAAVVWLLVYLHGPIGAAHLVERTRLSLDVVNDALASLVAEGRISAGDAGYESDVFVATHDDPAGWEAAFFDTTTPW